MSVDQPGSAAPMPPGDAPRRAGGPKRPPRPERPATPDTRSAANGAAPASPGFTSTVKLKAPAEPAPAARKPWPDVDPDDDASARPAPRTESVEEVAEEAAAPVPASGRKVVTKAPKAVRRGRRVKRVVRRIDLWSVLKLSLVVYTCIYAATLATLAALWGLLYSSGSIERLQSFLADVGLDNFTFYGDQMFRASAAIGAVGVIAGTIVTVLAMALVNIISEMTGGIRLVVIEEDVEPKR